MPLYIDLHIDNSLTLDLIKQCHMADKAIQERYGVRYLQILLNQPQGYLFCLVEGPDKESCAKVHQEAHGNIACNILEITQSDFSALLAGKKKDGLDFTVNPDGTLDTGIRAILALNLLGSPDQYHAAKKLIREVLEEKEGRSGESFENQLVAVFDSCSSAVEAGTAISKRISESSIPVEVRMGISLGSPLEAKGKLFEDVVRVADQFAFVAGNGQIAVSSKVMHLVNSKAGSHHTALKVIHPHDEKFLSLVMECAERIWDKSELTMAEFAHELGLSKSQLARKLKPLTSLSPNDFLKEFRLRKSIRLMEDRNMNIAEVTMAVGFSNPSYFTKCFRKRFGKAPSDYMIAAIAG